MTNINDKKQSFGKIRVLKLYNEKIYKELITPEIEQRVGTLFNDLLKQVEEKQDENSINEYIKCCSYFFSSHNKNKKSISKINNNNLLVNGEYIYDQQQKLVTGKINPYTKYTKSMVNKVQVDVKEHKSASPKSSSKSDLTSLPLTSLDKIIVKDIGLVA